MSDFNSEFDMGTSATDDALAKVRASIRELISMDEMVKQMEEDLSAAKKQLHSLRTGRIPDLMAEIQSDRFNHAGYEVKLSDFVSGSLPKDPEKLAGAISYLEGCGGGGIIKTEVKLHFPKSEHEEAVELAHDLENRGFAPDVKSGVHPQTLQAFARQKLEAGESIDPAKLGLFTGKVAKIKKVKK
jgi:hypothetical protein